MKTVRKFVFFVMFVFVSFSAFAFEKGFTLGLRANFSGSYTDPYISKADMKYLGAEFMTGMLGYIMSGEAELTYIFDSIRYFNYTNNNIFGGLGLCFNLGIGQGFSGQISGSTNATVGKIDVYCRVYMTPVLNFGTSLKAMLLRNRLAVGLGIGGKMLLDPHPTYELYTNLTEADLKKLKDGNPSIDFYPETGTLVVPEEMMKKMNPLSLLLKLSVEYNQPVISTMGLTLGGYLSYSVYKPKYVVLPKKVEDAAIANGKLPQNNIDVNFKRDSIDSFFMNNLDFGVSLGLLFKV